MQKTNQTRINNNIENTCQHVFSFLKRREHVIIIKGSPNTYSKFGKKSCNIYNSFLFMTKPIPDGFHNYPFPDCSSVGYELNSS